MSSIIVELLKKIRGGDKENNGVSNSISWFCM